MTPLLRRSAARIEPEIRSDPADERCPGCDTVVTARFCSGCGERRPGDPHYSLHDLAEEALENFVHLDGTLMRTVRTSHSPYADRATVMVTERLRERRTTLAVYTAVFNAAATSQAKSLVIIMVPVFALLVALVNHGRRRYALHHGVFALHFYAVFLVLLLLVGAMMDAIAWALGRVHWPLSDAVLSLLILHDVSGDVSERSSSRVGPCRHIPSTDEMPDTSTRLPRHPA